jgi:autotransporter-associated beta strand protein
MKYSAQRAGRIHGNRRASASTAICAAVGLALARQADGANYSVVTNSSSGTGSLAYALLQAQTDPNAVINFSGGLGTITLVEPLPMIENNLVINGDGNTISGANDWRIFFVNAPGNSVQINGLTLSNGLAQGGAGSFGAGGGAGLGGAVFVNAGTVSFASVAFSHNAAVGGNGGSYGAAAGGGGGGMGYAGGNGAIGTNFLGGGGGGGALTGPGQSGSVTSGGTGGGSNAGTGGSSPPTLNGENAVGPNGGGGGGGIDSGPYAVNNGGNGGNGGDFSGGGGGGSSLFNAGGNGGNGGFGGGGGGGGNSSEGAPAPYNSSSAGQGGNGGFGGGGGAAGGSPDNIFTGPIFGGGGGYGGGAGGYSNEGGGGGGAAFGAAVFVRSTNGASVSFTDTAADAGSLTAGLGGASYAGGAGGGGAQDGGAFFLMGGNANFNVSSQNSTETIAGSIGQYGAASISKLGAGTLALTATNDYSDGTIIDAGEVSVAANSALGASVGGIILNGGYLQITGASNVVLPRAVSLESTGGFDIASASNTVTDSSNITGGGSLTEIGPGTLGLSGANTYSGGTTIDDGTLKLVNVGLAPSTTTITSNAALEYNDASEVFQSGATLSGAGAVNKTGAGKLVFGGIGNVNVDLSAGSLIDVEAGTLVGSSSYQGIWTSNMASLDVASGATFDAVEAGPTGTMQIDALTGAGVFQGGYSGNTGALSTLTIGVAGGGGTFSGVLQDDANAHLGIVKAGVGTETFTGSNTYTGGTTINNGALVIGAAGALPGNSAAIIGNGATPSLLQLAQNIGTATVQTLTINKGASLDLTNNRLIVDYGSSADPASTVRSELISGYNSVGGSAGDWQGFGITSSTAAANPSAFSVGYSDGGNSIDSANTGVPAGQIEIKYTVAGDANLSGGVDLSDLVIIASDFGQTGADWAQGDVNYDGNVDLSDLVIVASNFGASVASVQAANFSGSFQAEWRLALAEMRGADVSVPEPASLALAAFGAAGLLTRIRNRRQRQSRDLLTPRVHLQLFNHRTHRQRG